MGQSPICSFCNEEEEKEQNLITTKATNFFISQTKTNNTTSIDRTFLRSKNFNYPLNLTYLGHNSYIVQEGFGIINFNNNSIFKGIFHNGVPCGWGIYEDPTNGVFKGEYDNDKPKGYGIYMHITESWYEGYWNNEKQEGIGIENWVDDSIYSGEFIEGKKCGIGVYIFPNNNIYLGEWSQNLMNGWGIYNYGKSNIYMGEWKNGLRDGYGEIYDSSNNYFFGFFRNNLENGFFMFYNTKYGKIIVGYNTNGKADGIVKYFKRQKEGKLIIIKNGRIIMEIEDEIQIKTYLNNKSNFDDKIMNKYYHKYFYMKRDILERILIKKCNEIDIDEINEQIKKVKKRKMII